MRPAVGSVLAPGGVDALIAEAETSLVTTRPRHGTVVVAIADVEPERAVRTQHAPDLAEHADHAGDVLGGRGLEPELASDAVVAQAVVRRTGDNTMDRLGRQRGQHVATIARHQANRQWSNPLPDISPISSPKVARAARGPLCCGHILASQRQ